MLTRNRSVYARRHWAGTNAAALGPICCYDVRSMYDATDRELHSTLAGLETGLRVDHVACFHLGTCEAGMMVMK